MPRPRKPANPFRYFHSSPEVIRLVVMMYVRFPLSLRNVEDLLFERGIEICRSLFSARKPTQRNPAEHRVSQSRNCTAEWDRARVGSASTLAGCDCQFDCGRLAFRVRAS